MSKFVHLHLHSDRSALDSIIKIPQLVKRVRELGMNAVAVTDHGVVAAAVQLYKEANKEQDDDGNSVVPIKPIIGMEAYLSPTDDHTLREKREEFPAQQCYHLTLLAKNAKGVSQLFELSSRGYLEGFYYKPRVSLPMVRDIGKDLIVLGACAKGPVSWNLREGNQEVAEKWLRRLKDSFGKDFYLELMDHDLDWQKTLNVQLAEIGDKNEVVWIPTNDSHFLLANDHYEHSIMMCLQLKATMDTLTMRYPEACYFRSAEEMASIFGEEACLRTVAIAEQINIELELGGAIFPLFE